VGIDLRNTEQILREQCPSHGTRKRCFSCNVGRQNARQDGLHPIVGRNIGHHRITHDGNCQGCFLSRRFFGPGRYFTERYERRCCHSVGGLGRRRDSLAACKCVLNEFDQGGIALHRDKGNHAHLLYRCLLCLLNEPLFEVLPSVGDCDANDAYRVLMDRQCFRSRRNFFIARKRKLKGGATPLVRARPKAPAMRLDDRTAY